MSRAEKVIQVIASGKIVPLVHLLSIDSKLRSSLSTSFRNLKVNLGTVIPFSCLLLLLITRLECVTSKRFSLDILTMICVFPRDDHLSLAATFLVSDTSHGWNGVEFK